MPPAGSARGLRNANAALLEAFSLHLATRAAHTRAAYLRDAAKLCGLAGEKPVMMLARSELARFLATLYGGGLSGRSLARMLSAWRAFFRFLIERDPTLREDPTGGLKAPKSPKRLSSALTPDEAVRLVSIEGDGEMDLRDRALFELAYSSGLRLSELAGLDVDRLDLTTGEVRVFGKGATERIVPVGAPARTAIETWLAVRVALVAPTEPA